MVQGRTDNTDIRYFQHIVRSTEVFQISDGKAGSDRDPVIITSGSLKKQNLFICHRIDNGTVIIFSSVFTSEFSPDNITYTKPSGCFQTVIPVPVAVRSIFS